MCAQTIEEGSALFDSYEAALRPARERFMRSPAIVKVLSPEIEPVLLEAFLIQVCARGVAITAPVEGWLRRAGEACLAMGIEQTGRALVRHARDEAGHDRLFAADVRLLVARWNAAGRPRADADQLMAQPPSGGALHYSRIHEDNIGGATPYTEVAIEYEIEGASLPYGGSLMRNSVDRLGSQVLEGLSFIREHVQLDVGHTHLNRRHIRRLLQERPDVLPALEAVGQEVLEAWAEHFADCLEAAVVLVGFSAVLLASPHRGH